MILSEQHPSHFDLEHLSAADIEALSSMVSAIGKRASSRQAVAEQLVMQLFDSLRVPATDEPGCALVRCFQTVTYARMPLHYQFAADQLLGSVPPQVGVLDQMRCLALLATHGLKPVWNDVMTSVGHQAIPLPSVEVVKKAPMIARLFDQLGMSIERAVAPPDSTDFQMQTLPSDFSVFHIADAVRSPFVPAQATFVEPYGVRSVIGMGGVLPEGELIAVVLFTRLPVSNAVAQRLSALAAAVRCVLLPFPPQRTFHGPEF